jgi:hypothetical protein
MQFSVAGGLGAYRGSTTNWDNRHVIASNEDQHEVGMRYRQYGGVPGGTATSGFYPAGGSENPSNILLDNEDEDILPVKYSNPTATVQDKPE